MPGRGVTHASQREAVLCTFLGHPWHRHDTAEGMSRAGGREVQQRASDSEGANQEHSFAGKRTRSGEASESALAGVQRRASPAGAASSAGDWNMTPGLSAALGIDGASAAWSASDAAPDVQRKAAAMPSWTGNVPVQARGDLAGPEVGRIAERGVEGASSSLPHLEPIQRSFGHHDIGDIRAQVGGVGTEAASKIGAEAYATGNRVAFAQAPDLHTAAHEAAHVVQQRAGVHLKGGVGQAGDVYERHADAVADLVVRGESAAALLDQHTGGGSGGSAVQRREEREARQPRQPEPERARGSGSGELDRRVGTHGGQTDGSGDWGSESDDRGVTDRANHYMWTRVALAAETMGMPNAARHMRHYLGNTGATLTVNADAMLRDVALLRDAYDRQLADARQRAELRVAGMGANVAATNFQLTGERRSDVYCSQSASRDWYFAIGGFTYWYTAEVQVEPVEGGAPRLTMLFTLHVFDRYNWDQGKAVEIAGITVRDEQLGRLHRVGLAQEYDVNGTSTAREEVWSYAGTSTAPTSGNSPTAGSRDGGRTDPTRERGRHVDNVRGS